jgi:small subunit ribosomal protein S8
MMTDPIADMLTRIRNASSVHKNEVTIPFSKIKMAIATILVREGYIAKAEETKGKPAFLVLTLKYNDKQPVIQHLARVSTPGHRRYVKTDEIKPVLNGFGMAILSTPRGILSDKEALAAKVGGELLCEVY